MSSDPTRPMPQWWQQPQGPQDTPDPQDSPARQDGPARQDRPGYQDGRGYQESPAQQDGRGYQDGRRPQDGAGYQGSAGHQGSAGYQEAAGYEGSSGYQGSAGYQGNSGYQDGAGYQGYRENHDYQATQRFPQDQGSQETQMFPPGQGYQPYQPSQGYQGGPGMQGAPPRSRRRRRRWPWITVLVILVLLVVADRGANAYAENQMASQFQSSLGLSGKPHVAIEGFPFLTQLAARDFNQVDISATNETITARSAGSGVLEIASLTATLHGMHIHGTNSATIDQFNASALITFTALGNVGGVPQGVTLSADGPNQVKATFNVDGFGAASAVAKVTQVGSNKINVHLISAGDVPTDLLGNLVDFTITIPKLPAGVSIQGVSVTQQGLRITATGHNTTLSQ